MREMKVNLDAFPPAKAYTLLVYYRFKKIDEEVFGGKKYHKRSIEQIKESEFVRREFHENAINCLTRQLPITEEEAMKVLEDECERLVKEEIRDLKEDEQFCGCCRCIIKRGDWEKHREEKKEFHDLMYEELKNVSIEATQLMMVKVEGGR